MEDRVKGRESRGEGRVERVQESRLEQRENIGCLVVSFCLVWGRFCCFFLPEQSAMRCVTLFTFSLCRLQ